MYVCQKGELKLKSGQVVRRGQVVPDAENWPENILHFHIRTGILRKIADAPKLKGSHASVTVDVAPLKPASPVPAPAPTEAKATVKASEKKPSRDHNRKKGR
jgi:hypothetical protein